MYRTHLFPGVFLHSGILEYREGGLEALWWSNVRGFGLAIVQCVFMHKPIWDPSGPKQVTIRRCTADTFVPLLPKKDSFSLYFFFQRF